MTNQLHITTWRNDVEWCACFGDYDLGAFVGTGKTEALAVSDLLDHKEDVNGRVS